MGLFQRPSKSGHVILFGVRCSLKRGWLLLPLLGALPAIASDRIGDVECFGYKGLNVVKIREILSVHEGGEYTDRTKSLIRQAVAGATGKEPADVAVICCDEKRNRLLFIGLPGLSYKSLVYKSAPKGNERLSSDIMNLYSRLDHALEIAVRRGANRQIPAASLGFMEAFGNLHPFARRVVIEAADDMPYAEIIEVQPKR